MDGLKDLILRYCVLFGRRFSYKEKIAFLRVITKELIQLDYDVDAKIAKLQLARKKYENYYNAYIGNLEKAELIVATHYDTNVNCFGLLKTYAFASSFSKVRYFIGLLPILILFLFSLTLNYFIFVPCIQDEGFFGVSGVLSFVSTVVLFYFVLRYKNGVPNKRNFVCNTSSILTIINLIKQFDKKEKKSVAFVLMDAGCTNQYGLKMLENYSKTILKKKIIFIDSIGNSDQLQFFKPTNSNILLNNIEFHNAQIETRFKDYIMITAGALGKDNRVLISHANSCKDDVLPSERVRQHSDAVYNIIKSMISDK